MSCVQIICILWRGFCLGQCSLCTACTALGPHLFTATPWSSFGSQLYRTPFLQPRRVRALGRPLWLGTKGNPCSKEPTLRKVWHRWNQVKQGHEKCVSPENVANLIESRKRRRSAWHVSCGGPFTMLSLINTSLLLIPLQLGDDPFSYPCEVGKSQSWNQLCSSTGTSK